MGKFPVSKTGYLLAVVSAFLYALQVVIGKIILTSGIGAENLLILQYTGATVILFIFLFARRKHFEGMLLEKRYLLPVICQGIFGCCATSLFLYLAMEKIAAGICSMLLYLCPVYVCLFFVITGIRRINLFNKISVAMAFIGAVFVLNIFGISDMKWSVLGLVPGFLAGICYAFYGIFSDLKLKSMPVEQMLFYMYLVATITLWILNPDFLFNPPHIEGTEMWILIIFVMLLQVLPMAFLNISIRMIGSNRATVIATAELPFTVILAFLILGERMKPVQVIGILMITSAVVLLQINKEKNLSTEK